MITVFAIDRLTKYYILNLAEIENSLDIYVTSYLNLYLINHTYCIFILTKSNIHDLSFCEMNNL